MPVVADLARRIAALDWPGLYSAVDRDGHACSPALLTAAECRTIADLFARDELFRKSVDLDSTGYGANGSYRYFSEPVPEPVATLREAFYPPLADLANRWAERLGSEQRFPSSLQEYRALCEARGQAKPTPLLLDYEAGGYNLLHQDLYGDLAFPLQITGMLSRPGTDFDGGEFLLVEDRPPQQSRGEAIVLQQGQCILFPNRFRPVDAASGGDRVEVRHGVSRVRRGRRRTLGIIFHDAR